MATNRIHTFTTDNGTRITVTLDGESFSIEREASAAVRQRDALADRLGESIMKQIREDIWMDDFVAAGRVPRVRGHVLAGGAQAR